MSLSLNLHPPFGQHTPQMRNKTSFPTPILLYGSSTFPQVWVFHPKQPPGELLPRHLVPCEPWARRGFGPQRPVVEVHAACFCSAFLCRIPASLTSSASSNDAPMKSSANAHMSHGRIPMLIVRDSAQTYNEESALP